MKTKYFILAALVIGMMVGATSCKKKTVNPSSGGNVKNVKKIPTEDQLKVKTNVATFVYGEPLNDYGVAVVKRLENRVYSFDDITKAVVVFNSAVPTLTEDDYVNIYKCYKNGGDIVICSPTKHNFANMFRAGIVAAAFKEDIEKYSTEGFSHENWMNYVGNHLFVINDSLTPDAEGTLAGSLGFNQGHRYVLNRLPASLNVLNLTAYDYGVMADGVAEWLNTTQAQNIDKLLIGRGSDITEISVPQTLSADFHATVYHNGEFKYCFHDIMNITLKAYVMHEFDNNKDTYLINQEVNCRNSYSSPVPDVNNHTSWWYEEEEDIHHIESMNRLKTDLWLTASGSMTFPKSHPGTTNTSQSGSCSTGAGEVVSGQSACCMGFSGRNYTGNFWDNFSNLVANEDSYSITVGKSHSADYLSVTKDEVFGVEYDKACWDYKFKDTYLYESSGKGGSTTTYKCWWAAPLAITDSKQQNSMLYSVIDQSGQASVHCSNVLTYEFGWIDDGSQTMNHERYDSSSSMDMTLSSPNRYSQKWTIDCYGIGFAPGGYDSIVEIISNDIMGGSHDWSNYIGGVDQYDNTEANNLLNLFVDEFASHADEYVNEHYWWGPFTFRIKGEDGRYITKSYTLSPIGK